MRWLVRILSGLVLLALIGVVYQLAGEALDSRRYPPPGRLVDVGGHRLHLSCTGEGNPTVILEAAGPGWSLYWSTVQPEIAKRTRVCSYDRAGFGWSESGPSPRTGRRIATELHTLLAQAGISGPYLLVGHSLGGFVVRLYRHFHPTDVVGMVLVEAGQETELRRSEFRKFIHAGKTTLPLFTALTALDISRLLTSFDFLPPLFAEQEAKVPAEIRPMLRAGWLQTDYPITLADEAVSLGETVDQVQRAGSLGNLPLIVLTATGPIWWPDMSADIDQAKFRETWLQLQTELTNLSSDSRQIFAEHSSHLINFDQPELIVDAVRQLLETGKQAHRQ